MTAPHNQCQQTTVEAVRNALEECANRCRYDGDLFHDQRNELRRDASWKAADMARDALAALPAVTTEGEPVAWQWRTLPKFSEDAADQEWSLTLTAPDFINPHHHEVEPLYRALPASKAAGDDVEAERIGDVNSALDRAAFAAAWNAFQNTPIDLVADSDDETCRCVHNAIAAYLAILPASVDGRDAVIEACDLLAERKYGNPARSPGHNARLVLERALSHPATDDAARLEEKVADEIIGQIEERFPNWRSYRDLIDCIDCTLHALRGGR
jgi:hypothetical protein